MEERVSQKIARKSGVIIRMWKKSPTITNMSIERVVAFRQSAASSKRVESRRERYNPYIEKTEWQRRSARMKITKLESLMAHFHNLRQRNTVTGIDGENCRQSEGKDHHPGVKQFKGRE